MTQQNLYEYITSVAQPVRKGETVITKEVGGVTVTEVFAFPSRDEIREEDVEWVDVHFFDVAIDKTKVEDGRHTFMGWCDTYPEPERLAGGPSYIEIGGVVGDQQLALMAMAVGQALGLWKVLTPKRFGFEGAEADSMAGKGFVMISGYEQKPVTSKR